MPFLLIHVKYLCLHYLAGAKHVLWVDFVWLAANFCTFLIRFAIFHYVLFTGPVAAARRPT